MIQKIKVFILPVLFVVISILIMTSGSLLKEPLGTEDQLYQAIVSIEKAVNQGKWDVADEKIGYAVHAWDKVVNRIQFGVERNYLNEISDSLSRMRGNIKAEDKPGVLADIYLFYDYWESLGK